MIFCNGVVFENKPLFLEKEVREHFILNLNETDWCKCITPSIPLAKELSEEIKFLKRYDPAVIGKLLDEALNRNDSFIIEQIINE